MFPTHSEVQLPPALPPLWEHPEVAAVPVSVDDLRRSYLSGEVTPDFILRVCPRRFHLYVMGDEDHG